MTRHVTADRHVTTNAAGLYASHVRSQCGPECPPAAPCPYVRLDVGACLAGAWRHKGPHEYPPTPHCTYWLHRLGGPVRCAVDPDGHPGAHDYPKRVAMA